MDRVQHCAGSTTMNYSFSTLKTIKGNYCSLEEDMILNNYGNMKPKARWQLISMNLCTNKENIAQENVRHNA